MRVTALSCCDAAKWMFPLSYDILYHNIYWHRKEILATEQISCHKKGKDVIEHSKYKTIPGNNTCHWNNMSVLSINIFSQEEVPCQMVVFIIVFQSQNGK